MIKTSTIKRLFFIFFIRKNATKKMLLSIAIFLLFFLGLFLSSCQKKPIEHLNFSYQVCTERMLPDELKDIIEKHKGKKFKLSYLNNSNLYIAIGYGKYDRNDLSVVIRDLYQTPNEIYIKTTIISDKMTLTDSIIKGAASRYPYIVLKCDRISLPINYDIQ